MKYKTHARIRGGLLPGKRDSRDRSHALTFGSVAPDQMPTTYVVEPLDIDNQFYSQFCTAFMSSEDAESQWNRRFSAEFQAAKEGQVDGQSIGGRGTQLRTAYMAGKSYGFLPIEFAPFSLETQDELFLGDWHNWPADLDSKAAAFKMDGFYNVDGYRDIFDNIKSALWISRAEQRTVGVGTKWYAEWEQIGVDGMIPTSYAQFTSLHAHRIIGFTTINGIEVLIDQQAQGKGFGNGGICYFPREVVNKEFTEGSFLFRKNPDPGQIKTISLIVSAISKIISIYAQIIASLKPKPDLIVPPEEQIPPPAPPIINLPTVPPETLTQPPTSKIEAWARAIQTQEGGKPSDRNMTHNNPGNLKWTSFTMTLGPTTRDAQNFCYFKSYNDGFNALCDFLRAAATKELKPYHIDKNGNQFDCTLEEFTQIYAEPPANHPYAKNVADTLKVAVNIPIRNLL